MCVSASCVHIVRLHGTGASPARASCNCCTVCTETATAANIKSNLVCLPQQSCLIILYCKLAQQPAPASIVASKALDMYVLYLQYLLYLLHLLYLPYLLYIVFSSLLAVKFAYLRWSSSSSSILDPLWFFLHLASNSHVRQTTSCSWLLFLARQTASGPNNNNQEQEVVCLT